MSETLIEFRHVKVPMRNGVSKLIVDRRLSWVVDTLSMAPPARGTYRKESGPLPGAFSVWLLLTESDGDQLSQDAMSIGSLLRLSVGSVWSTWSRPGYCVRDPQRLIAKGPTFC